jgi:tRNA uridine 5-carboxymethylaminomethyl modification enzyme
LLTDSETRILDARLASVRDALQLAQATSVRPEVAAPLLSAVNSTPLSHAVRAAELAKRQEITLQMVFDAAGVGADLPKDAIIAAELELKYAGYFDRERNRARRLQTMGGMSLPPDFQYLTLRSLSTEARQKLETIRPSTLAQAAGIPGVTPADLQNLVFELHRRDA